MFLKKGPLECVFEEPLTKAVMKKSFQDFPRTPNEFVCYQTWAFIIMHEPWLQVC